MELPTQNLIPIKTFLKKKNNFRRKNPPRYFKDENIYFLQRNKYNF